MGVAMDDRCLRSPEGFVMDYRCLGKSLRVWPFVSVGVDDRCNDKS